MEMRLAVDRQGSEVCINLGTLTLGASPSQNLDDPRKGDAGLVHADALLCNTDNPSDPP